MPKAISSSSSDNDEAENVPTREAATRKQAEKASTKFECPQDFMSFCHVPCSSTLSDGLQGGDSELWLIKAPASFHPESFSGVSVPLSGLQAVSVPNAGGGAQQIYSVLASSRCPAELRLLTRAQQAAPGCNTYGPPFSGILNVCESFSDGSGAQAPKVIPTAPPPSVPAGLKQRFHPFGSKTPTLTFVAGDEVDGAAFGPSSTTLRPLVFKRFVEEGRIGDEEEERRRKKKKKKEKRMKMEEPDMQLMVKQEPVYEPQEVELHATMGEEPPERTKKKKKKKDREREEVEEGMEPSIQVKLEEIHIKPEPMDASFDDATANMPKKKKKKKKSRAEDE